MRTNIVIDDNLMNQALRSSGCTTKKDTVDMALRLLVQICNQRKLRKSKGKIDWEGDLEEMRRD